MTHNTWKASTRILVVTTVAIFMAAGLIGRSQSEDRLLRQNRHRYMVVAKEGAKHDALRSEIVRAGGVILDDLQDIETIVVSADHGFKDRMAGSPNSGGVAHDHLVSLIKPDDRNGLRSVTEFPERHLTKLNGTSRAKSFDPDPALELPGLLWNMERIRAPRAWNITTGSPAVTVAVADTGLDFTHSELAPRISDIVDFTGSADPPICKTFFDFSDDDLAAMFGGPALTDWNGHGSWIGGTIAAAADAQGINGIAPNVKLVGLKISQWCGFAFDSTILEAFVYAANHKIDVVSISFGGYLDPTDPEQELIYHQYEQAVRYALRNGTVIAASAGNEHVRVGAGGRVLSHGSLTIPGDELVDYFGQWQVPGSVPGVVDVSSTGNVVNAASASCPAGTFETALAVCKPLSDAHQPAGVGRTNQLAYYSNYGPRIDVAGPGGARKFNLPNADRGGTPGFPYTTADLLNVWEDFSVTSNWATQIDCFLLTGGGFPADQCYSTIQGTSMATPHASAVLALIASRYPILRGHPAALIGLLKFTARPINGNRTGALSDSDGSPGDLSGLLCPTAYCHLRNIPISDEDAYGAGLVDAFLPLVLGGGS